MGGIFLFRGKLKSQVLVIWVQVLQVEDSCQIQNQQEGKIHCQDSCK